MTTALSNVVSVDSLTNGPIPKNQKLLTLQQSDVSSTTVYADVIQIQWQSSDQHVIRLKTQATASSGASPASSTAAPGSRTSGAAAATSTSASPPSSASSALSTGAKAGIGIGVVLGVLALAGLAALFLVQRRRKRRSQVRAEPVDDYKGPGYHELAQTDIQSAEPVEMDARVVQEMPGTMLAAELGGRQQESEFENESGQRGGSFQPGK